MSNVLAETSGPRAVEHRTPSPGWPSGSRSADPGSGPSRAAQRAALEFHTGPRAGELVPIETEELLLGRHEDCAVRLAEPTVSRRHARIFCRDGRLFVEDLGSSNGTIVNGRQVEHPEPLTHEDRLEIGDSQLVVHLSNSEGPGSDAEHGLVDIEPDGDVCRAMSSAIVASLEAALEHDTGVVSNPEVKLRAVLDITRNLGGSLELGQVLPKTLESLFRIFPQAERGFIALSDDGAHLTPVAVHQRTADDQRTLQPIARSIARQVLSEKKAILSRDASADERFAQSRSALDLEIRSMMAAPLLGPSSDRALGIIHLDTSDPESDFTADDLEVLVSVAILAAQAIDVARLHEEHLELEREKQELASARVVQQHLLPRERPQLAGYRFFDFYQPAGEVGGDYYGYHQFPDGRLAIAVGDVSGKGLPAALLMTQLNSDLRYCLAMHPRLDDAVTALNRMLHDKVPAGRFITLVVCLLEPRNHRMTVVNAGHPPPLLHSAAEGRVRNVRAADYDSPLGMHLDVGYQSVAVSLEEGDAVVLYTDGVSEAMDEHEELFGHARISSAVSASKASADAIGESLLAEVRRFTGAAPQRDDTTLICFARESGNGA